MDEEIIDITGQENNDEPIKHQFGFVSKRNIVSEMETSYLEYAMSVIVARALPDVRDGLKPVHRRILYVMLKHFGLKHNSRYRKSANITGTVMGGYHPHGDVAIYDSMVRLAQDFNMRYQLVDGQGNFGSIDGYPAAAPRYTEARLRMIAEELLADLDKDTVDFITTYDGEGQEPSVLPSKVPNLLLNGQTGIAVGMATSIPPHNLGEVIDATLCLINNPEATLPELLEYIKGPDFPTGGMIFDEQAIASAYATGRGSVVVRGKAEIVDLEKGDRQQIIITEIPYQVNKSTLVEKMANLISDKRIVGVADLRDESGKDGIKIVLELKKDAYAKKILNALYKDTPLQTAFHFNMLALVDGIQPQVLNLEEMLKYFIDHREVVVRRRCQFELKKAQDRAHIVEGLKLALDQIDEVISTIRASKTQEEASNNLIKKFKLTPIQAKAILSMQLRVLAGLERQKIEDELTALKAEIARLEEILSARENILKIIKEELSEIKEKYQDERRTLVIPQALGKFSDEDLVPNESVVVLLTLSNYIKRMPLNTYRAQNRGGKGIVGVTTKEEDIVTHLLQANNHDSILFFTSLGRVFKIKIYEIPQSSRTAKGQALVNLLNLAPEEKVTSVITLLKNQQDGYLFMATKFGTVKKTALSEYQNIRPSGIIAIKIDPGDELGWVKLSSGKDDILISTALAKANRFNETDVRAMGRATRGMRGIKLAKGDVVVGMDILKGNEQLLVVMENGYGKRTNSDQFSPHRRGGVGIKAGVITPKTGPAIDVRVIDPGVDELMIISKSGVVIRQKIKGISIISRATQGVRIMKLNNNDTVASIALVSGDDEVDNKE